jgi:hypothetical protein
MYALIWMGDRINLSVTMPNFVVDAIGWWSSQVDDKTEQLRAFLVGSFIDHSGNFRGSVSSV